MFAGCMCDKNRKGEEKDMQDPQRKRRFVYTFVEGKAGVSTGNSWRGSRSVCTPLVESHGEAESREYTSGGQESMAHKDMCLRHSIVVAVDMSGDRRASALRRRARWWHVCLCARRTRHELFARGREERVRTPRRRRRMRSARPATRPPHTVRPACARLRASTLPPVLGQRRLEPTSRLARRRHR
uniref:Expressed protein n=1 Tax=Schizophyllum commune (strain H4-8 / FGSC 9210) TaxID=578458 RepID=D8QGC1_SCHCM